MGITRYLSIYPRAHLKGVVRARHPAEQEGLAGRNTRLAPASALGRSAPRERAMACVVGGLGSAPHSHADCGLHRARRHGGWASKRCGNGGRKAPVLRVLPDTVGCRHVSTAKLKQPEGFGTPPHKVHHPQDYSDSVVCDLATSDSW